MSSKQTKQTNGHCFHCISDQEWQNNLNCLDSSFSTILTTIKSSLICPSDSIIQHFTDALAYNVPHGKKFRGTVLLAAYNELNLKENLGDESSFAAPAAWSIELLQASFLIHDDIMDQSLTRRNRPCWYTMPNVGMMAINDGIFIEQSLYLLLKKFYGQHELYAQLVDLFHEVTTHTSCGQALDMKLENHAKDFTIFNFKNYFTMIHFKTCYYSFYLPVAAALLLTGVSNQELLAKCQTLLLDIGEYFQIQDDYLDVYGDSNVLGKIGTDIQDGKCSWLALTALENATPDQVIIFQDNYGKKDEACVQIIRQLYTDLNVQDIYSEFEDKTYSRLCDTISTVCSSDPVLRKLEKLFFTMMQKLFKRQK